MSLDGLGTGAHILSWRLAPFFVCNPMHWILSNRPRYRRHLRAEQLLFLPRMNVSFLLCVGQTPCGNCLSSFPPILSLSILRLHLLILATSMRCVVSFPWPSIFHPIYDETVCNILPWTVSFATKGEHAIHIPYSAAPFFCLSTRFSSTVPPPPYTKGGRSNLPPIYKARLVGSNPTNPLDLLSGFKFERDTWDDH